MPGELPHTQHDKPCEIVLRTGITVLVYDSALADEPFHNPLHARDGVGNELKLLTDTRVILLRHPTVVQGEVSPTRTPDPLYSVDGW